MSLGLLHTLLLFFSPLPTCFLGVWWESGWVGNGVKVRDKGKVVVFLPPSPQNHEGTIGTEKFTVSVDII